MLTCFGCGYGMEQGVSLFKLNRVGVIPSVWACRDHMTQADSEFDREVLRLADVVDPSAK